MGKKTDKITGRAKQAVGAVTGDEETKREGERQENKGRLKGKVDSTVDKAQDALEDPKDKGRQEIDDRAIRAHTTRAREIDLVTAFLGRSSVARATEADLPAQACPPGPSRHCSPLHRRPARP